MWHALLFVTVAVPVHAAGGLKSTTIRHNLLDPLSVPVLNHEILQLLLPFLLPYPLSLKMWRVLTFSQLVFQNDRMCMREMMGVATGRRRELRTNLMAAQRRRPRPSSHKR